MFYRNPVRINVTLNMVTYRLSCANDILLLIQGRNYRPFLYWSRSEKSLVTHCLVTFSNELQVAIIYQLDFFRHTNVGPVRYTCNNVNRQLLIVYAHSSSLGSISTVSTSTYSCLTNPSIKASPMSSIAREKLPCDLHSRSTIEHTFGSTNFRYRV